MAGFPTRDANMILVMEIILVSCIFTMNGADEVRQILETGSGYGFTISSIVGPALFGGIEDVHTLHTLEQIGWWGHLIMVLAFLNYLPYSKHLHILLAFPNTYYSNLEKKGKFSNMESVTNEVKLMLDPTADPFWRKRCYGFELEKLVGCIHVHRMWTLYVVLSSEHHRKEIITTKNYDGYPRPFGGSGRNAQKAWG